MNIINKIDSFGWADWSLHDFNINYERVSIEISFEPIGYYNEDGTINKNYTGEEQLVIIHCNNFIGFSFVGHWDESVIEDITIEQTGNLITNSLQEVKHLYGDPPFTLGGGIKKIDSLWYQLNIKLIDGNIIKVACDSFEIESNTNNLQAYFS